MAYNVTLKKQALKYITKLAKPTAARIYNAIEAIKEDPTIGELLTNHTAQYKYRVGNYRILYDVFENELCIDIIKIGPRGDVYN